MTSTINKAKINLSKDPNFDSIMDAIGDSEIVMIGEASHGTHEYYKIRAELTKRLIEEKNFNFVTVEADWPDTYRINRYVQNGKYSESSPEESLQDFKRFPYWMWKNTAVLDFIKWLRSFNDDLPNEKKVGFYGMDLYSFFTSVDEVIKYLEKVDPDEAMIAKKLYGNFDKFRGQPEKYGLYVEQGRCKSYEKEVVKVLCDLHKNGPEYIKGRGGYINGDELFYTKQNGLLVKDAEEYYRKTYVPGEISWNIRDTHMVECIQKLMEFYNSNGRPPKLVIWAHSSHLGDARATESTQSGQWNVGELMRKLFGFEHTFNIGFSSYNGTVTASSKWGQPEQFMVVNNGLYNSYEHLFHTVSEQSNDKNFILLFRSNNPDVEIDQDMVKVVSKRRLHRYIGVIYRPDTERWSHYSESSLTKEFDAFIHIDISNAVIPLNPSPAWTKEAKKYKYDGDSIAHHLEEYPELKESLASVNSLKEVGDNYYMEDRFGSAVTKYNRALKLLDYHKDKLSHEELELYFEIKMKKVECCMKLGHYKLGLKECNEILAQERSFVLVTCLKARIYLELNRIDLAMEQFEKASSQAQEDMDNDIQLEMVEELGKTIKNRHESDKFKKMLDGFVFDK
jgi:erythromycin esterase-like protein